MAQQTVLITGCSSGIGLATAKLFAQEKQHAFKVYATMRNLGSKGNLEKAAGDTLNKTLFIRELDVTKETTIKSVVDEILQEDGRIDVLINNAGCNGVDAIDQKPLEWCQAMMDTNYWGVVRCVRAVLPAMKKQKSGRIVNVSSIIGVTALPFYVTYSSSKFAVEGFSESIAPVLRDGYNIRVSIVEPGPVYTEMMEKARANPPEELTKDFDPILKDLFLADLKSLREELLPMLQYPDAIAKLLLEITLSENPHLRYQTSEATTRRVATKLLDTTTDGLLDALKR